MPRRVLIVDDEILARKKIRGFLRSYPDFVVAGECADGHEAVAAIRTLNPDIIFLDIRMPGLSGMQVLESFPKSAIPAVIFVTAYDKHAVQAFELRAVDYLLKPFNRTRFAQSLEWAVEYLESKKKHDASNDMLALLRSIGDKTADTRILVKSGTRTIFLDMQNIEWISAERDYVRFHLSKETHLVRETMTAMARKLDPRRFVRIHRSMIVNLDFVKEMRPQWGGDHSVLLKSGAELTLSRSYRANLQALFPERFAGHVKTGKGPE